MYTTFRGLKGYHITGTFVFAQSFLSAFYVKKCKTIIFLNEKWFYYTQLFIVVYMKRMFVELKTIEKKRKQEQFRALENTFLQM